MKTANNLRTIVKKYLDNAAFLKLEDDLEHQTVTVAAGSVMLMLDEAMMDDKITIEQRNEASELFGWVNAYPDCRECDVKKPTTV